MLEHIIEIALLVLNGAALYVKRKEPKPKTRKPKENKIIKDESWKQKLPSQE